MKFNKKFYIIISIILLFVMGFAFGCTQDNSSKQGKEYNAENNKISEDGKILISFFSRADENYRVGYVEKGNTQIIAEYIESKITADFFQIARKTPYPSKYSDCTAEAQKEKNDNARPELAANLDSIDQYEVIFLGYPIWYGTMPMPVYTFLEKYDFSGKTIIPFSTNEGSGFGNSLSDLNTIVPNATIVSNGFSCRGSSVGSQETSVADWLEGLDEILNIIN